MSGELREEEGFPGCRMGISPRRLAHFMERKAGQVWERGDKCGKVFHREPRRRGVLPEKQQQDEIPAGGRKEGLVWKGLERLRSWGRGSSPYSSSRLQVDTDESCPAPRGELLRDCPEKSSPSPPTPQGPSTPPRWPPRAPISPWPLSSASTPHSRPKLLCSERTQHSS